MPYRNFVKVATVVAVAFSFATALWIVVLIGGNELYFAHPSFCRAALYLEVACGMIFFGLAWFPIRNYR